MEVKFPVYAMSTMRWDNGATVAANLSWDSKRYYLWFEITEPTIEFCEKNGYGEFICDTEDELAQVGIKVFRSIEEVNEYCAEQCGDNEPARFVYDATSKTVEGV